MRRGFTLIELLVVIAIIAILAAILFPVFAKAKAKAKETQCLSNISQIGKAITLYMADYDDIIPAGIDPSDKYVPSIWNSFPDWKARIPDLPLMSDLLQNYAKSKEIFHCPSDDGTETLDNQYPIPFPTAPTMFGTYGSSYFLRTEIIFQAFSNTTFQSPANINLMMDGAGHWHGGARALSPTDDFQTYESLEQKYRYNVLYGDFHAKGVSKGQLSQLWATRL